MRRDRTPLLGDGRLTNGDGHRYVTSAPELREGVGWQQVTFRIIHENPPPSSLAGEPTDIRLWLDNAP